MSGIEIMGQGLEYPDQIIVEEVTSLQDLGAGHEVPIKAPHEHPLKQMIFLGVLAIIVSYGTDWILKTIFGDPK